MMIILQKIEYFAFRAMVFLIRLMPLDVASAVFGRLWRWLAPLNKRHRRALDNIAMAMPDMPKEARRRVIGDMWENLGRVVAESFQLDRLLADPDRILCDENEMIASLSDRGSLIISLHAGNWEICVWPVTRSGYRPAGVYQRIKNPFVDAYIRQIRAPLYPGGLFTKSHDTARKLVTWVRQGGQLGVLADQRDNKGITVPFFGHDAPSTPLPAMLAVRLDVPVVIGRVIRTRGSRFRVEGELLDVARTGDRQGDTLETTRRIQATFERWIRENPAQWMWGHRRWKS